MNMGQKSQYLVRDQTYEKLFIAQQLKALTAIPEDVGSTPKTYVAVHSCL